MKTNATKDFSSSTLKALRAKRLEVVSAAAVAAFPGDAFFSGTAYTLSDGRLKTFLEVLAIAEGR